MSGGEPRVLEDGTVVELPTPEQLKMLTLASALPFVGPGLGGARGSARGCTDAPGRSTLGRIWGRSAERVPRPASSVAPRAQGVARGRALGLVRVRGVLPLFPSWAPTPPRSGAQACTCAVGLQAMYRARAWGTAFCRSSTWAKGNYALSISVSERPRSGRSLVTSPQLFFDLTPELAEPALDFAELRANSVDPTPTLVKLSTQSNSRSICPSAPQL